MAKIKKKQKKSCYLCNKYEECRYEKEVCGLWEGKTCGSFILWDSVEKQGIFIKQE